LNSFSKDDLRKYLKINRKIEQVSLAFPLWSF